MSKLYTLYALCLWYISSSHEVVAERVLDFQQDVHILCPGLPVADYCNCQGDCNIQPDWCACEEAQSCCSEFQTAYSWNTSLHYDDDDYAYDDDYSYDDRYASDKPEMVFHALGICSALLSVIGSSAILLKILRGIGSTTPYDRIILGLCTCDIVASITIAVDHFLVPNKTSLEFEVRSVCRQLGFVSLLSTLWSVWYNGLLSFHFLLIVLSQLKRKELVRKYERWMHASGMVVPINAIWLFLTGDFGTLDLGTTCYVTDLDHFFARLGFPFWLSFVSILINYIVIYALVRKSLGSNQCSTPRQDRRKKEVTTQMVLYVGFFFVTWAPTFVWYVLYFFFDTTMNELYPLRLLMAMTIPLQGFFNAFIYFKPAYTRARDLYPNKSRRFALHQALFNRNAPKSKPNRHRDANGVTHGSVYITDITLADPSDTTDPSASNAVAEEDTNVGITGIDFENSLFFDQKDAADDKNDDSPLDAIAEETDDSPNSNS